MQNFLEPKIQLMKFFTSLGLTKNQAIIYLALVQSGISTVKQISNGSKMAREQIYRICPKLVDSGLIEKIISTPIRFEALPIKEGISLLIKRRTQEIYDLQKEAMKFATIAKRFCKKKAKTNFQNNHSDFIMIPKRVPLIKRIKQSIDSAQESISIITSMKRHSRALFVFDKEIKNALSKGVRFRVIAGEIIEDLPKIAKEFDKHPLMTFRYISSPPTAVIVLVDNSRGFVITSPTTALEESPALQLENLSLVRLLQEYFEYFWSSLLGENEPYRIADITTK